jgi:hypothetical protein
VLVQKGYVNMSYCRGCNKAAMKMADLESELRRVARIASINPTAKTAKWVLSIRDQRDEYKRHGMYDHECTRELVPA